MEFTNQQKNQLKQLKDTLRLKEFQSKCDELSTKLQILLDKKTECLGKRKLLMERLTALQEEYKNARNEQLCRQQKLEEVSRTSVGYQNDNFDLLCSLLGFRISKCKLLPNNGLEVTLCYRAACYVTYSEIDQTFDLIDIFPQYFDFAKVQQFLQTSQDLRGLLACLRKFFDLALELKEKQEQT